MTTRAASYRMLASSLLILFSSNSRALAFRRSAMNCTSPRMLELLLVERPRKPPPVEDDMMKTRNYDPPLGLEFSRTSVDARW